jgi:nucleoside-diphosphate-sugar epimerase
LAGPEQRRGPVAGTRLPERVARRLAEGDERFVVTGASGWFGLATLDLLRAAIGPDGFQERVAAFASERKKLRLHDGAEIEARALRELPELEHGPDHVLHYAYVTRDRAGELGVERFAAENLQITEALLGALDRHDVRGVLYPSSGAVYGPEGALTTNLAGNPYGALKRIDELALRQRCHDAGAALVVARVFNVGGPYMTKRRLYALGDLIDQAQSGGSVRIAARGLVRRSFISIADLVALSLDLLLEPAEPGGQAVFDAAGEEIVEIRELAERVLAVLGCRDVEIERDLDPAAPPSDYVGDGARMRALARERGFELAGLDEVIRQSVPGPPAGTGGAAA